MWSEVTSEEPLSSGGRDLGERVGAVLGQPLQGHPVRSDASPAPIGSALTREPELRALLRELHDQLLRRDEEIERLARLIDARGLAPVGDQELRPLLTQQARLAAVADERTAWAERMAEEAERRADLIEGLHAAMDEQRREADEQRREADRRAVVIEELQVALEERTAWAERMVGEAERRLADNRELHRQLASAQQTIAEMQAHPVWRLATQLGRMRSWPRPVRRLRP